MTDDELTRLEALAAGATMGPWHARDGCHVDDMRGCPIVEWADGGREPGFYYDADAAFIAASRAAVPALIARVRELQADYAAYEARLHLLEANIKDLEAIVTRQRAAHSEAMAGLARRLEAAKDLEREMAR